MPNGCKPDVRHDDTPLKMHMPNVKKSRLPASEGSGIIGRLATPPAGRENAWNVN